MKILIIPSGTKLTDELLKRINEIEGEILICESEQDFAKAKFHEKAKEDLQEVFKCIKEDIDPDLPSKHDSCSSEGWRYKKWGKKKKY